LIRETLAVSITTVPVVAKMLTHERKDLLLLFRARSFCPNLDFCSMSEAFVTVLTVKNYSLCVRIQELCTVKM